VKKKTANKKFTVIDTYKTVITYTCPKRGLVSQIVNVKRYETPSAVDYSSSEELEAIDHLINNADEDEEF